MKQLELKVPDNLNQITAEQYIKIQHIVENETDDYMVGIKMVSILCEITEGEARAINKDDYDDITQILIKTLKSTAKWRQRFTLNGVEYGFLPKIDDMSIGEYIDLDTFIKDTKDINKVMTILYRPISSESFKRYEVEPYTGKEDYDIMLDAPMDAVQGSMVFFYHLGNELLKAIPNYLMRQGEPTIAYKQILEQSGVGIQAFTDLQTGMFYNLIVRLNNVSTPHLHS